MPSHAARITLAEYARRIRARAGYYYIDERMYASEASVLESHRWVRCVRLEANVPGKRSGVYRVALTRLGVREVAAMEADLGRLG